MKYSLSHYSSSSLQTGELSRCPNRVINYPGEGINAPQVENNFNHYGYEVHDTLRSDLSSFTHLRQSNSQSGDILVCYQNGIIGDTDETLLKVFFKFYNSITDEYYEYVRTYPITVDVQLRDEPTHTIDSDNDGIPNYFEIALGLDTHNPNDAYNDLDGDGLSNLQEYNFGTFLNSTDSDNDGYLDVEVLLGSANPENDDDGDGYTNYEEVVAKTDWRNPNSNPNTLGIAAWLVPVTALILN